MILVVHTWHCTLCDYSRTFDPAKTEPPETCTVCRDGSGMSFTYRLPPDERGEHKTTGEKK